MDAVADGYAIDDLLKVSVSKEDQTTRVESVIQDPDSFSTITGSSATARFTLPEKGQVLAPNGRLIFKATWSAFNAGVDRMLSLPRFGGALSMVREARLFCGALIERNTLAGHKINLENNALPYDSQNEVLDVLLGSNHGYAYAADGTLQLTGDIANGSSGSRALTNDDNATVEFSIPLDSLFSCLKDVMIPTFLKNPIVIEIDFDLTFANGADDVVISSGGGVAATGNVFVKRPRLDLDYLVLNEEMVNAFRSKVMVGPGLAYNFRNNHLIQKVLPAAANSEAQENDLELGLASTRVMKLYVEKQLAYDNVLLKGMRSDGLLSESMQLFINNQNLFDRTVDRLSDMYVYWGQALNTSAKVLNGAYELVGDLVANNIMSNDTTLPAASINGADGSFALVKENLQGRQRWLGINLGQARSGGNDNPMNSLKIGESPIVLRLNRTIPAAAPAKTPRGESNTASSRAACNVNVFAEVVKIMMIQNGEIMVANA
jgi:hypothetical protein